MTVRVFILDDHELIRIGLRAALETEQDITVVGEASTAEEALTRIPATRPDVAVIDLHLEQGRGLDVCRELRAECPEVRWLVLTAYSDQREVLAAMKAGASGYVLKQRSGQDLLAAIRGLAKGGTVLDPEVAEWVVNQVRAQPDSDPRLQRLSQQERRVLELIAAGATNREIAATMFLAETTVRNYVSNLLAKLGMQRRSEAAAFAARLAERGELPAHD